MEKIKYSEPYCFFVPKDFALINYRRGFKLDELFTISNYGVRTDRDSLFIDMNKNVLKNRMQKLLTGQ